MQTLDPPRRRRSLEDDHAATSFARPAGGPRPPAVESLFLRRPASPARAVASPPRTGSVGGVPGGSPPDILFIAQSAVEEVRERRGEGERETRSRDAVATPRPRSP